MHASMMDLSQDTAQQVLILVAHGRDWLVCELSFCVSKQQVDMLRT